MTLAPEASVPRARIVDDPLAVDPTALADTTERLVVAAAQVFAERGYDGAGVAEIARRAGLTTGAIYSRFSGKAELLAEAIRSFTGDEFDELFAEHAFEGRVTDILATVGSHLVTREPAPAQAILLEAFVAARRDPEVAEVLRVHLADRSRRPRSPGSSIRRSTPPPSCSSPMPWASASSSSRPSAPPIPNRTAGTVSSIG
jgi:AcrR family transcriptional regulator